MLVTGARTVFPVYNTTQETQSSNFSQFSTKISPTHLSFHSNKLTHFGFCVILGKIRNGSGLFVKKSPRKGVNEVLEIEGFDSDDEFEEVDDEFDDEFEEVDGEFDEDEDIVVPMRNMKKWLENKPLGFGEGKEYDTTIEDKLAEEIEQSRIAQLANLNKLKNNPQSGNAKNQQKPKVPELISSGIRVRLVNLPKKKNIIRDLQRAFKGFPGMINIVPVVSGNKKTREPICTGIAFIFFKSTDDAMRFIQTFSRQSIAFGKIQKQIKYEMMDPSSPQTASEKLVGSTPGPRLAYISANNDLDAVSNIEDSASNAKEVIHGEYDSEDNEHISTGEQKREDDYKMPNKESPSKALPSQQLKKNSAKKKKIVVKGKQKLVGSTPGPRLAYISANNDLDVISNIEDSASNAKEVIHGEYDSEDNEHISTGEQKRETVEAFSILESSEEDNYKMPNKESPSKALPSQQPKKNSAQKKKIVVKGKQKKSPKLNILGSAKRLKIKEKAVLTDVFSKYGQKADAAVVK